MKFELPKSLKRHWFFCDKTLGRVNYSACQKVCPNNFRQCWEQHLRDDFATTIQVANEDNVEGLVRCSECGTVCTGMGFNQFMCHKCGDTQYVDAEAQKALLDDVYIEMDEQELAGRLKEIV